MGTVSTSRKANSIVLSVKGDFTFDIYTSFRNAYKRYSNKQCFTVDLSETGNMDSSGLGMLVQLREFAGGNRSRVTISGTNNTIAKSLQLAKFDHLFTLS